MAMGAPRRQGNSSTEGPGQLDVTSRPGNVLKGLCLGAQRLVLAAPYIKADALATVLANVGPAASLICVTRWNPHDLAVGVSDPECRTIVNGFGGSFRLHPSLHAKYYRIDDVVLIGSANLTSSAMGWSPQPNLEILCHAGKDFDWCAFQRNLLRDAREISDDEFMRWEAIGKINARSEFAGAHPRLDTWRPRTRDPRHLEISYQGKEGEIASFDERRAARRDLQALLLPTGLSNEEVRVWASTCLLAAPFTNTVIQIADTEDAPGSYQLVAQAYGLGMTEARRDVETVQNWLVFFAPETLR